MFMKALLVLGAHLYDGACFPSDHSDHFLVTLALHWGSINTDKLIPVSKSRLVSRSFRVDHTDIQDSWITDALGSNMKGNTDDPVRKFRVSSMPIGSLAPVLFGYGRTGDEQANYQPCHNI